MPPGSSRSLVDPYAPKKSIWPKVVVGLLVLAGVAWGLYRFNILHRWFPQYVPAHHTEVDLETIDDKRSAAPGESIVLVVKNGAKTLQVRDWDTGLPVADDLAVTDGKATLTIPAGTKPTVWKVGDGNDHVKIRVVEPEKKN
jgi:hypothetical protein